MKESLQSIVDDCFREFDLDRIEAYASPEDDGAVELFKALSFQTAGVVQSGSLCFSLQKSDWTLEDTRR